MTPQDLELVPTDLLLAALVARFDHVAFAGRRTMDQEDQVGIWHWAGDEIIVAGLAAALQRRALRSLEKRLVELPDLP